MQTWCHCVYTICQGHEAWMSISYAGWFCVYVALVQDEDDDDDDDEWQNQDSCLASTDTYAHIS